MGYIHHQQAASEGALWDYTDLPVKEYNEGSASPGSTRRILIGRDEGEEDLIVRYFTLPVGGHSSHEHHRHPHSVVIVQGHGRVLLGEAWHPIGVGDAIYIEPHEVHQFQADTDTPLGFLCIIPAWAKKA